MKKTSLSLVIATLLTTSYTAYGDNENNENKVENILIYAQSPLSFQSGLDDYSPGNQHLDADKLDVDNGNSLARILDNQLVNVAINDVQNNPFQADLQYRGFTASPLLGLPQGLSVYLNGTRFNEPFGDTVNWDLIPPTALESVTLVSGANPIFGQNTLGGSLLLNTKDGFSSSQHKVTVQGGDFGQQGINVESGGNNGEWGYYINLNRYQEDGWRDYSPSDIKQGLANVTHKGSDSSTRITLAVNENDLIGNGAIPVDLIPHEGRAAIYTRPDQTFTNLKFINLNHEWELDEELVLRINAYFRKNEIETYNGDDSDYEECDVGYGETLCEEGEEDEDDDDVDDDEEEFEADDAVQFVGYDALVPLSAISSVDADELDGTANTSLTDNISKGFSVELAGATSLSGVTHNWVVGLGMDVADIDFSSDTEFAILDNDTVEDTRGVTGIGVYDEGSRVRLQTDVKHSHFFISDMIELTDTWQLALAGRYNRTTIDMVDGVEVGEGSLNGNHKFSRLNPSATLHYRQDALHAYASYSQSSRTPSPAELSCADEDDPCKLPNGFVADPPLDQVVTDTLEIGANLMLENGLLHAALYRSESKDDIIFQQAGDRASVGYFVNIDKTRRQGGEVSILQQWDDIELSANVSYLQATYESPFVSFSPQNPLGSNRQVSAGDTIPGQPEWQAGVELTYPLMENLYISADVDYASGQYFRGDEANENRQLDGYTLVNLSATYAHSSGITVGVRLENVFDTDFETFGTYGEADEVLENIYDDIDSTEFVGVGQPRTLRVFASYAF
jgi:outer membrane receptor for Fe3+-dicitrate